MRLEDLYEEFVLAARAANRSPETITWYDWQIGRFGKWLDHEGLSRECDQFTATTLRGYIASMQETLAPQTIANNVKALKALFAWGLREEILDSDHTTRVAVPKVPRRDHEIFSPEQVDTLLRACNTRHLFGARDYAIVMLLFDSGLRASELCGIHDEDVAWKRESIKVYGKGARERSVPVSARTLRAIHRYQRLRTKAGHVEPRALFVNNVGNPLTRNTLAQLLERLGQQTGLHCHAHKFRHSFAVNSLRNGAREFDIQGCLGHATLTMTREYARQTGDDLKREHRRFSPVDRLKSRG